MQMSLIDQMMAFEGVHMTNIIGQGYRGHSLNILDKLQLSNESTFSFTFGMWIQV